MSSKTLIAEEDVLRAVKDGSFTIHIDGIPLITPLAASSIKEHGVTLIQGNQIIERGSSSDNSLPAYEAALREVLCEAGRRLKTAGFMSGGDGNLSSMLNQQEVLITPSRLDKGHLMPHQIIKIDRNGNKLSGDYSPSVEGLMHLAAFEERPDICAVAHAHPPYLIAFTAAGLKLPSMITPETELFFGGEIPVASYAAPGTKALADSIRELIRRVNLVLLDHHGVLAVGQDIIQAATLIEHAEASAKVIFLARMLGGEKPLPHESIEQLRAVYQRMLASQSLNASCHALRQQSGSSCDSCELETAVRKVVEALGN